VRQVAHRELSDRCRRSSGYGRESPVGGSTAKGLQKRLFAPARVYSDVVLKSPSDDSPERQLVDGLIADCQHAIRLYVRSPGASVTAVVVLAVAMAFVSAFLSLYVDQSLRPLAGFENSARIATVGRRGDGSVIGLPFEITQRMADEMVSVEATAASIINTVLLGRDDERIPVELVSAHFFDGLRPRVALGRGFLREDHAREAEPVTVISFRLWRDRFGLLAGKHPPDRAVSHAKYHPGRSRRGNHTFSNRGRHGRKCARICATGNTPFHAVRAHTIALRRFSGAVD
jgi:hypothetical protein